MKRIIPYGRQHISDEDIQAVVQVLRSDYLTQGPEIAAFEAAFCEYIGCKYAVACCNGTAALHLACLALGVGPQSRVLTSPLTFAASANCVLYCGGSVDFADIDSATGILDVHATREKLAASPPGTYAGIVVVDYAGCPADLPAYRALADEFGLWVLEDACHAPGASGAGFRSGDCQYTDAAVFSLHPVKHIAAGEGGVVTTNRKDIYDACCLLRTHGITRDPQKLTGGDGPWYYEMQELGLNYRLTDFQAALATSQLKRAETGLARRRELAKRYQEAFADLPIEICAADEPGHALHLFVILVEDRAGLFNFLKENGVAPQVHYIPVHTMPYYQGLGFRRGQFPKAEQFYARCLSLPLFPTLLETEQDTVIQLVRQFVSR
jgi:UDP-4-amino-4,6-dideoxy-N-acetyl-beta-L-altrosamine transaminase